MPDRVPHSNCRSSFTKRHVHHATLIQKLHQQNKVKTLQELRRQLPQAQKTAALQQFAHNPQCNILLMDDCGAVGLDLSFVEHVFLLEPLVDTAHEQQIVSRAHRMGATRPCTSKCSSCRCASNEAILLASCSGPAACMEMLRLRAACGRISVALCACCYAQNQKLDRARHVMNSLQARSIMFVTCCKFAGHGGGRDHQRAARAGAARGRRRRLQPRRRRRPHRRWPLHRQQPPRPPRRRGSHHSRGAAAGTAAGGLWARRSSWR